MDAAEIIDQKNLEAWLNARPEATRRREVLWISTRAAERLFPLFVSLNESKRSKTQLVYEKHDFGALPVLRALLTSGVAAVYPEANVRAAALHAASPAAAASAASASALASSASIEASMAALVASGKAYDVRNALEVSDGIGESEIAQILSDARAIQIGDELTSHPLWSSPAAKWFADADRATRILWSKDPDRIWDFWLRWWDGLLSGQPLDWELQRRVALIPNEIWDAGACKAAEAIREIELVFAVERTPNAEILSVNPATGLVRTDPVSHLRADHLEDIVDTLTDASHVFDDHGGPNGPYATFGEECKILQDGSTRYHQRPIMLLRICRRVVERVKVKEANGDCPKNDPLVADFASSVAGAAGDLMAFDPDVREAETARAQANAAPLARETGTALILAADQSATIAEGDLQDELPGDARTAVADPTSTEGKMALYATKSRLLRVLAIVKKAKPAVDHLERYPLVYGSILAVILFLLA